MVDVPLEQLTKRQLTLHMITLLQKQAAHNERWENSMGDLTSSVEALQGAVDTMAVRFATQTGVLTDALANAQGQLADLQVEDDATKAALSAALDEAASAAESINSDVAELNGIGAEPDVPVEAVPVEELPAPPSETSGDAAPADAPADGPVDAPADTTTDAPADAPAPAPADDAAPTDAAPTPATDVNPPAPDSGSDLPAGMTGDA